VIWLSIASALIAVAAALYVFRMGRRTPSATVWSAPPKARRGAPLVLNVLDADIRMGQAEETSHYAFLLSLANDSAIPRVFTELDLRVRYRTAANFSGAVDVPLSESADAGGGRTGEVTLRLPLVLGARQSIIGWAHFATVDVIPRECRADGYAIAMKGNAGERLLAEATLATVIDSGSERIALG
jgi:hypothetical protein